MTNAARTLTIGFQGVMPLVVSESYGAGLLSGAV
jgi:hypothetical protein